MGRLRKVCVSYVALARLNLLRNRERRACVIFLQAMPEAIGDVGPWELGMFPKGGAGVAAATTHQRAARRFAGAESRRCCQARCHTDCRLPGGRGVDDASPG